jgi:hypothetical protein
LLVGKLAWQYGAESTTRPTVEVKVQRSQAVARGLKRSTTRPVGLLPAMESPAVAYSNKQASGTISKLIWKSYQAVFLLQDSGIYWLGIL